jgi:hypothetical protein
MEGTGYVQIYGSGSWRPEKLTDLSVPDLYQSLVLNLIVNSKLSSSVKSFKLVGNELVSDLNQYVLVPAIQEDYPGSGSDQAKTLQI